MPVLLQASIGVRKRGRMYRMARINHCGSSVYYFVKRAPHGFHVSVHDAQGTHAKGVIQMRLEEGEFLKHPERVPLGNKIRIREIPSFASIEEPVCLPFDGWVMSTDDEILGLLGEESSVSRRTDSVVLDVDELGERFVGWFVLLLRPGDLEGAERRYRAKYQPTGYLLENVRYWKDVEPWLAVGFISRHVDRLRHR